MELVEGQMGSRNVLIHSADGSRGHVTAQLLNVQRIILIDLQIGLEPLREKPFFRELNLLLLYEFD